jgi:dTDP-glucose 4,6-dehydratase
MRKILVTGGAGFIGSNFNHYLQRAEPDAFIVNLDVLTYAANLENLRNLAAQNRYLFIEGFAQIEMTDPTPSCADSTTY